MCQTKVRFFCPWLTFVSRGFVLTANMELTKRVGLKAKKRHIVFLPGMEARLLEFDIF
jgi:putative N6-adenine-specific DNA methylase